MGKNKEYTILVTNDDGINAPGIRALIKAAGRIAKVYVVAPSEQNSATSQKVTFLRDVTATEVEIGAAKEAYQIDGTPTDCVKWAIQHYGRKGITFDFVLSGINMGNNAGSAVVYSGTVAAAREAAMSGIRAIALSVDNHKAKNFDYICSMLHDLLDMSRGLYSKTVLSVNAPDVPMWKVKGVKVVPAAGHNAGESFDFEDKGNGAYRLHIEYPENPFPEDDDWNVLQKNYVAITPITVDYVDHEALLKLNGLTNDNTLCVMVDFQEKLIPAMRRSEKLESNIVRLARCLNRLDVPMLVTEQYSKGLGATIKPLQEAMGTYEKVDKIAFNCLEEPAFQNAIEGMTSKKIILCGIEAHICLQQTALGFLDRGYEVIILKDCCASRKKADYETAMELLASRGCRITTWESFVFELLGHSQHPAFRKISEIVKEQ